MNTVFQILKNISKTNTIRLSSLISRIKYWKFKKNLRTKRIKVCRKNVCIRKRIDGLRMRRGRDWPQATPLLASRVKHKRPYLYLSRALEADDTGITSSPELDWEPGFVARASRRLRRRHRPPPGLMHPEIYRKNVRIYLVSGGRREKSTALSNI